MSRRSSWAVRQRADGEVRGLERTVLEVKVSLWSGGAESMSSDRREVSTTLAACAVSWRAVSDSLSPALHSATVSHSKQPANTAFRQPSGTALLGMTKVRSHAPLLLVLLRESGRSRAVGVSPSEPSTM